MKKNDYLDILKYSLATAWENKRLWWLGLFVFLSDISGNLRTSSSSDSGSAAQFLAQHPFLIVGAIVVAIALMVLVLIARILGKAALICSAGDIKVYGQSKIIGIISEVKKYFWKLLLLEVFVIVGVVVIMVVMAVPLVFLFSFKAYVFATLASLVALCILVPILVLAYFLRTYGYMYVVLGGLQIRQSLEGAYELFIGNVKKSLLMAIIMIGTAVAFGILCLGALFVLASIFGLLALLPYLLMMKTMAISIMVVGAAVFFLMFVWFVSGYETFKQIVWVRFFKELAAKKTKEHVSQENISAEKLPNPEAV
jgi:hypothetical protein